MVHFKFAHQRSLEAGIRFEVARDRLAKLQIKMSEQFATLKECTVPRTVFDPMVRSALMICPLESTGPGTREAEEWASLNTISGGFAPLRMRAWRNRLRCPERHHRFRVASPKSRHLHRDRHGLQRLAGTWLTTFARECAQPGFAIDMYLGKLETSRSRSDSPV